MDFESVSKQVRVPVNAQMFQKSNHKGMAVILCPLLKFFDRNDKYGYAQLFEASWFPYALAEMKQFKQTCLFVANDLAQRGVFPAVDAASEAEQL